MAADVNITAYSDALVVLGTAGVLIPIFRRWGVNPVLGYLAAGALLGPLGLGSLVKQFHPLYWFTITNATNIRGIAELGIVFLLFVIGLDLSMQRLAKLRVLVGGLGGMQVLLCTAVISIAVSMMGQSLPAAVILGTSLAFSSTAIVLEILSRQNRMSTHLGQTVFAVLLAQDLAAIPVLMFVAIGGSNAGGSVAAGLVKALVQGAVAVTVIALSGRYLMRPLFRVVGTAHSTELFIAAVLFVIVATGVVAHQAGLSMALGAFIAGLLLAETEFRKAIQAIIEPFKGILLGIFFFTVGMRVDIRELIQSPGLLAACVVGLIVIKAAIITPLAKLFRLSWPSAFESGLLLGPCGEFAFVIIGIATDLNLVSEHIAGLSLAVTSVTMATTPVLSFAAGKVRRRLIQADPELAIKPHGHTGRAIVVGYGRVGKVVCSLLRKEGVPFIAADFDPVAVAADRREGHEVYFGDAANPEFLKTCGIDEASGVIITINAREAIDSIVAHVRSIRPDVPIIARARDADHARHLCGMGASEVVPETIEASLQLSEAALVGLGVPIDIALASVQDKRLEFRRGMHATGQKGSQLKCDVPKGQ